MRYYHEKYKITKGGLILIIFAAIHSRSQFIAPDEHKLFYQSNLPIHTNDDHFLIH